MYLAPANSVAPPNGIISTTSPVLLDAIEWVRPIPPNAMRVGPDSDAVVWRVCPGDGVEI